MLFKTADDVTDALAIFANHPKTSAVIEAVMPKVSHDRLRQYWKLTGELEQVKASLRKGSRTLVRVILWIIGFLIVGVILMVASWIAYNMAFPGK